MTPSGIKPATCRFVAWCLNPYANACPTSRCRQFKISFPSLTVLSYSSYSLPLNFSLLQNLLSPFFQTPSGGFIWVSSLCSSLPGHFGICLIPHFTPCRNHLRCANSIVCLSGIIPNSIPVVLSLILSLSVYFVS